MLYLIVPIIYGNVSYRKKFDAFRIVDASGHEPLKEAISVALELRDIRKSFQKVIATIKKPTARLFAIQHLQRLLNDEFYAWAKIAEFVHSKPKQLEVTGTVTLEQLLAGTWDDSPHQDSIGAPKIVDVG